VQFADFIVIFMLGVSLSMDALAVSVCKGLAMQKADAKSATIVGTWFGGFQALMPFLGYVLIDLLYNLLAGTSANSIVESIDHWIAFVLLSIIGINMIRESKDTECDVKSASLGFGTMFAMAVATSIDALAVGVSLRLDSKTYTYMFVAIACIGVITFALSFIGVKMGSFLGSKFRQKAQIAGGIVLILIGVKMVIEGLLF